MPSRRENGTLRPPAKAPAANRLYNLQQANSSSSLVPRGADGTPVPYPISHGTLTSSQTSGASSSTANPGGGGGYPSALDPPFLTNAESHFGRMTLTAPDNMRRKKDKDKEKRAKQRQKKASAAQAAAFALSGGDSNLLSFSQPASENGFAVAGPSRRPAMNRLPSSENRSTNGGSRSGTPSEQTGRLDLLAASAATTSTTTSSGRRRGASHTRPVINDEDSAASRPSSRSSRAARDPAPRRPTSSHSQGAATSAVRVRDAPLAVPSSQRQRSESAPSSREPSEHVSHGPARSTTRRSGSETGREDQQLHPSSNDNASSLSSALAQQASLRRHNIWNDLTDLPGADEPDPDDLPPPFPEGATRPRSPPLPPSILGGEWTEEHRRLQEEAERYRVPDSPPPAFRTDPSDESGDGATDRNGINDGQIRRTRTRRTRRTRRRAERSSVDRAGANDADEAIPPSDASAHASATGSASESSESEGEAERLRLQMAEERVAWEADLLSGLSFEERFRREMERREARERVAVLSANEVNRVRGNTDQVEVRDEWDQGEQEQEQEQEVWEEVREVVSDTQNEISVSDGPETQAGIADGRNGGSGEAEGVEEPVEEAPQPITISEAEAEIELATTTQHEIVATSQQPASTVVSPGATGVHSSQRSAAEGEGDDLTSIQPTSTSSLVSPAGPSTFRSMHTTTLKQEATLRPLATKEHRRTSSDLTSHRATSYSSRSQPTRISLHRKSPPNPRVWAILSRTPPAAVM
ncbi:hypothetical protein IE53DRAFT_106333 [Violaceomyces palustris]|uniref:Uncharacterized protein n=1 Tax=Violaceomyces palustris TaxID=1673888 RepID=A0ACD0NWL6_9BASI|nr:hypothetical protein IE53DRAFT_106333 [Violaceomyces palustris]